jgi:tetratricopeptide (TPR) repeat protein
MLLATALALVLVWPAHGQAVLYQAQVQTDSAEVRCKPGTEPTIYVTQRLKRGDLVQVVEKGPDGWLKIEPPRGSYSFINTRSLRTDDPANVIWTVTPLDSRAPVLVGSPFKQGKPDVVGTTLTGGTQVIAVGALQRADDGDWLPILPPPGEYRYVRETDVTGPTSGPATTAQTVAHEGAAGPAASSSDPTVRVSQPASNAEPLLQQAIQQEQAGNRIGAARLYDQLGNKYVTSNPATAQQYYERASWLRINSVPAAASPVNEGDTLYAQARAQEKAGNYAEASRSYSRLGDMYRDSNYQLSLQYYNRAAWLRQAEPPRPAPTAVVPVTTANAAPASGVVQASAQSVQMLGPGQLLRAATPIDGRPTYVLNSAQGAVIAYLTPQAGVNLEPYVGQNVEALGQIVPRNDIRDRFMTVVRVRLLTSP